MEIYNESNEAPATEYPAPELVKTHGTHFPRAKTVDWWSLGVIICEILTAHRPFTATDNHDKIHQTILHPSLTFPMIIVRLLPPDAKDLVTRPLDRDPLSRLGISGFAEIKAHPFFDGIDWPKLLRKEYVPAVDDTCDTQVEPEVAPEVDMEACRQHTFGQWFMSKNVASDYHRTAS